MLTWTSDGSLIVFFEVGGGGTCQSTGFSRMYTQSSCSRPFTIQAGSHQVGTAIVVVTLPLLSAAAVAVKRSLQSNSARLINSSSPANARRLQGHCEACQSTAVSRWVGDYIVSSGRFFSPPAPLIERPAAMGNQSCERPAV